MTSVTTMRKLVDDPHALLLAYMRQDFGALSAQGLCLGQRRRTALLGTGTLMHRP